MSGCRPSADQFAGTWKIDAQTSVPTDTVASATLTLKKDGRFAAVNLPSTFLSMDGDNPRQGWSGKGTWSIKPGAMPENLALRFTNLNDRPVDYGAELTFKEWAPTNQLFYFVGDPDDAKIVSFKRVATP